ncbi:MAG: EAL domain-containing protein [Propionivibrio sp.]|nr:EAL domain-containing protein [Propionivibrio sp.]
MPETQCSQIFLGRQPILGREQNLFAYKLLFRDGLASGKHTGLPDPTQATATVIANAFTELATSDALGPYRGFIKVDHELLFSDLIEVLPPQRVGLEISESSIPTEEVVARCRQLHDKGFIMAIDDRVQIDAAYRPLLEWADIIKLDIIKRDGERLRELVAQLKLFGKQLLAEKVETVEQFSLCRSLGFDLFQGYYFARPTLLVGKKLNPSQLALIRLLGLVLEDADTGELENAFKLEPGLTVNLLRLTNSVSCGLATKITSLRHAITILGRRQLQRWLQLLIYAHPTGTAQDINPLLQLAATRGRLMELLAERLHAKNREFADHAFMVGILSLMPVLLGVAMEEILTQLPVALRVKQALTGQGEHSGQLGHVLQLVAASEQTDPLALEEALHHVPGINADCLGTSLAQALSWANGLGQEQDSTAPGA